MIKHHLYLLIFIGLMPILALAAPDKAQPISIMLGAENSWPPYSDENGQGISTNLINAAFAKVGINPSFKVLPYARVLHDLTSGKIDGGYNVALQASTKNKYIFGHQPLVSVETYWYCMPQKFIELHSLKDVPDGFKVGVILDYEYGDEYEAQRSRFKEVNVSKQAQIIRMLQQGRLDAGLMSEGEAEYALKELNLPMNTLEKRFLNHVDEIYLAFSPKHERSKWLAEQLDKGLIALKESGEYEGLAEGD